MRCYVVLMTLAFTLGGLSPAYPKMRTVEYAQATNFVETTAAQVMAIGLACDIGEVRRFRIAVLESFERGKASDAQVAALDAKMMKDVSDANECPMPADKLGEFRDTILVMIGQSEMVYRD